MRFLSVLSGAIGCMGATVAEHGFVKYTCETNEIVYNEPFDLRFDMWLTTTRKLVISRFVFSTMYQENGKYVYEHVDERGGPWAVLHTLSSAGEHYRVNITHVPKTRPGVPYHLSVIVDYEGSGSISFGLDLPSGPGQPRYTKNSPLRMIPMKEYHPHRPIVDFNSKSGYREHYYLCRPINTGPNQMLAPFNLRFEKRREKSGTEQYFDATEAMLVVRKAVDVFINVADSIDMISGDVRFQLKPSFYMGGMTFALKNPAYVDKGTGRMSRKLEDRARQMPTSHLNMPFDDKDGITQFDCELVFKTENEYWSILSSQTNPFRGICDLNNHYYIDMETRL